MKVLLFLILFLRLSFGFESCLLKVSKEINVSPNFFLAILKTESGLHPYAIGVSYGGRPVRSYFARTKEEAVYVAKYLYSLGYHVDVGLGQISIQNLRRWGIPLEYAFDPCVNLHLAGAVLRDCMARYGRTAKAVDCYNKGRKAIGYSPYVYRVFSNYRKILLSYYGK